MAKLPSTPLLSELFQAVSSAKTKSEKIKLLREYKRDDVKAVLIWNFDKGINSALPEGSVPYTPNEAPAGTQHTRLAHEWTKLYNFVRGGNDSLPNMKREMMFIQLLEGLHKDEAEIICLTKDKNLQTKYRITRAVVEEAYDEIQWRD